jgi:hypothetical protein
MVRNVAGKALLLMGSIAVTLIAAEAAFRMAASQPVLAWVNFRERAPNRAPFGPLIYDPDLGWVPRPWFTGQRVRTLAHGIRQNGSDTELRRDGVLAVGNSFTAGSEVDNHESWPAALEREIGQPVLNAGVGGYGTDQIVMRAEQLLPIVRPRVLLAAVMPNDIQRSGYASSGRSKPYYTVEDGSLVRHHAPVPRDDRTFIAFDSLSQTGKRIGGYSFAIHQIMSTYASDAWFSAGPRTFTRVANDPVAVTCRLLQRLKLSTDALGIRIVLLMQYGGAAIQSWSAPSDDAAQVTACARAIGIQLVDEFDSLKAVYRANPEALKSYYVMADANYGHMSARGNRHIATLIADALARPPVARPAQE